MLPCWRARRFRLCSFSSERTRIFSEPSSMARIVSSRYLMRRGDVTAVFTSWKLRPVSLPTAPRFFANSPPAFAAASVSMKASMKGCDSFEMSYSESRPLPMPSMDAKERKMKVKVDGKRKTEPPLSSVSVCRSAPSVSLMLPVDLPSCVFLKERMKKRASFSTAKRSAPDASTPIFSTPDTSRLALRESSISEISGPPSKSAVQNSRKPSRTLGLRSFIMPKS
mmetsp:Transcript_5512/g.15388  ORF Transcript_5512/g.15388 Transcript_5512/m.15388 type:complete len:224 (+) Transcript_5512:493-1164(+)